MKRRVDEAPGSWTSECRREKSEDRERGELEHGCRIMRQGMLQELSREGEVWGPEGRAIPHSSRHYIVQR